jgi:hypothetical protein
MALAELVKPWHESTVDRGINEWIQANRETLRAKTAVLHLLGSHRWPVAGR